ncbi:restriction endonuclease subunit S [Methylomonas sp. AM2-LC]|uniref:restriction endonuclease subunit S n=1 Tax=Methylomonas sp. AM2-LC TaxID=3153301 RepID=UPI003264592B
MNFDSPSSLDLKGRIPDDWDVLPIEAVTDFQEGPGILAKDFHDSGVPLLRLRNIETPVVHPAGCNFLNPEKVAKKWSHFALQEGDLLISTSASLGRVSVVGSNAVGSIAYTGIIRFRSSSSKLNHKYLRAFLSSAAFVKQAEQMATGSVIKHFGPSHLRQMAIVLPSLNEQVQIAEIFDALDNRIALLRETNATLEAIAQALFKSWFVDFDPVHAKQQGRIPEGMDEATVALFPDSFVETELGLLPMGWRIGSLGDIAQTSRRQIQPSELHAGQHYVGLEHIPRKSLSLSDWGNAEKLESAKAAFAEGDILFGKLRPYFHKVVIAPFAGVCSTDILVCNPINPAYFGVVAMNLFSTLLIDYAERLSNGAKMPRINWKDLAAYSICIPPELLAENFSNAIKPLIGRIMANVHQAKTLASLRDTLLPRLISGQMGLPDAENLIEDFA